MCNMNKINRMISKYNYTPGNSSRIKYIVIHYVGALGGAKENCIYYGGRDRGSSAHYFVGFDGEIWQCVEDQNIAWHCGASSYKHPECRNANSIGIEMCVRKKGTQTLGATDRDWYFENKTVQSTIELVRYLMEKYHIPADHVIRHYDVTGKICPNPYVYNEGKEDYTQVFAQMTKKDGSFLVSRTNTDNFDWKDLKGKTIIPGRKGGVPYMTFEYVLKQNGLNPETDLVLDDSIKFDLMAGAFAGGNAEYVTLFEPTASMTEAEGKGYVVASVGEASGEVPYTAYCAKKSYIEKNSETIEKFTRAIYKGQKWVKSHTSREIAEAIQSFFPSTSVESIEKSVQSYKDIDAWNETPVLKEESFDKLQLIMTEAGELTKSTIQQNSKQCICRKSNKINFSPNRDAPFWAIFCAIEKLIIFAEE